MLPGEYHTNHLRHALGQQAEEVPRQIGHLAAHMIGVGVALVDEIPVGLTQLMASAPLEIDALPHDLFTLLAHLLAFARSEAYRKILKIAIARLCQWN